LFELQTIIIRGAQPELAEWHAQSARAYTPRRLTLAIPDTVTELPGELAARRPLQGTVAYICSGMTCSPPLTDRDAFDSLMRGAAHRPDQGSGTE
jgi:hypothetical protein